MEVIAGREHELQAVDDLLTTGRLPTALVLEGDAGIGKTTLWEAGVDVARRRSWRVLGCRPAGSEMELGFAALRDLLDPHFREAAPALDRPKRHALAVALLLEEPDGATPAPGAAAAGFLAALRVLTRAGPVLLAVDDVQWLDPPSARVLEFALRRLRDEPVAVLVGWRTEEAGAAPLGLDRAFVPSRVRRLRVGPLDVAALQAMVQRHLPGALAAPDVVRLHQMSEGNPLFALELARALVRGDVRLEVGAPPPVPPTLGAVVDARLGALAPRVRDVLLGVAAARQPTVETLAAVVGAEVDARLEEAVSAGVIRIDGGAVWFTHPLFAAGAYAAGTAVRRRELHRRLAAVTGDIEERARHLSLAAVGPDSATAHALDRGAESAYARGATSSAADLADLAGALTPPSDAADAAARALTAAAYRFEAGDGAGALSRLEQVLAVAPSGTHRARALGRLGRISLFTAGPRVAAGRFRAALLEEIDDPLVRAKIHEGLAWALLLLREDLPAAEANASAAARLAREAGDEALLAEALSVRGLAAFLLGRGTPAALLEPALALERHTLGLAILRRPSHTYAGALVWADEVDAARAVLERLHRLARERGDLASLPWLLSRLSYTEWLAGRWALAARYADEGYEAALATGHEAQRAISLAARAIVDAHLGRAEEARRAAEECLALEDRVGGMGTTVATGALGFLALSLGDPAGADRLLGPMLAGTAPGGVGEPDELRFVPDAVEASLALDRVDEAERLTARLEVPVVAIARRSRPAAAARCRGLVRGARGDIEGALSAFDVALHAHEGAGIPFDRARTLLALGSTLRRARKKRAARDALEAARATFERLDAPLWTARCTAELGRVGGRPAATGALTITEQRVAGLVAQGRPTKEVAAELFVSVKTVEGHLSSIYAKLGVRSRAELAHRFAAHGGPGGLS